MGVELFLLLVGQLQVLGGEAVFAVGQQVVEADLLAAVVGVADVGEVGSGDAAQFVQVDDEEAARGADALWFFADVGNDAARLGGDARHLCGDVGFAGEALQADGVFFEGFDGFKAAA